jgi:hypothetical protein
MVLITIKQIIKLLMILQNENQFTKQKKSDHSRFLLFVVEYRCHDFGFNTTNLQKMTIMEKIRGFSLDLQNPTFFVTIPFGL